MKEKPKPHKIEWSEAPLMKRNIKKEGKRPKEPKNETPKAKRKHKYHADKKCDTQGLVEKILPRDSVVEIFSTRRSEPLGDIFFSCNLFSFCVGVMWVALGSGWLLWLELKNTSESSWWVYDIDKELLEIHLSAATDNERSTPFFSRNNM
jgi:hypothetical protein